jgi:glycosyltransferase involved in cell wall biosynthesis
MKFYNTLSRYDILYLHRRLIFPPEFWYLRQKANRIVYDFDDAVMYNSSGSKSPYSLSRRAKFAYLTKRVDLVIAGNRFLKSEVLRYNPHVEVIPTSIDLSRYSLKEDWHPKGPITIGWLGSSSTLKYLKVLLPTFEKLYQKYQNLRLKIVCDQFLDGIDLPVIKKRWSSEGEIEDLKSFDIGVSPLSDDLWSRGKCGLKILQYYGVGIPVVCTPVGVNKDVVKDGVNGFWAKDEQDWEDSLLKLIQEEGLRREMGIKGRETVERSFCIEVNAPRMLEILKKVSSTWDE